MNIYIDFDDCLCETARNFTGLVKQLFNLDISYENIEFFDLQKSFKLTTDQYEKMMIEAHKPEALLEYGETPGCSNVINGWVDEGHEVSIITGRPYSAYEPSRQWLDNHGLSRVKLYCLNKYGRDAFIKDSEFSLELEDYRKMHFDYAIEDSPMAFKHFDHLPDLKVLVFDRPWNKDCDFPNSNYKRCKSWDEINNLVMK